MTELDPRAPVLVGAGVATQREDNPAKAADAMSLMLQAVDQAGEDCGAPALLRAVGQIAVPKGRWAYGNPAGIIRRHIGAAHAVTIASTVGVLQQTLIGAACKAIAAGEVDAALVVGGDAGYRLLRSQITGMAVPDTHDDGTPDTLLAPADELRHPEELRVGLRQPVGLYAMIESAYRHRHGWSVADHQTRMASLYSRFTEIAACNPHAWKRERLPPDRIREASPQNPVQAFPYNKLHCSSWNVDQAGALLLCSVAKATAMGIPRDRWVFPLASSESNSMVQVSARCALGACPGASLAGQTALAACGGIEAVDLIELYSCFPVAVEIYAEALGIPQDRDLTVTGGMAFAGGPYNNYVIQATCRMADLLRERRGRTGLVTSVSGVLTKQGFGVWSTAAGTNGFRWEDVTAQVDAGVDRKGVLEIYSGHGVVAGFTVLQSRDQIPRAIVIADVAEASRVVAFSEDPAITREWQAVEQCGRMVQISDGLFTL